MTKHFVYLVWRRDFGSAIESLECVFAKFESVMEYVGEDKFYRIE